MAKNRKKQNRHHSHNPVFSVSSDLYKYTQAVFRERSSQFQRNGAAISTVYDGLDFDSLRSKRRIAAVTALAEELKSRFSAVCPDIPGRFSILEDWVGMNVYPLSAYDYVEKFVFSSFAAAIWMLDHIRDHGRLKQLNQILSGVPATANVLMPDVWDPCHSRQMLAKMVSVIICRNQDQNSSQKRNKQDQNPILRVYMDRATAEQKIDHTQPSRVRYDQVMSLIAPEALDAIKNSYTELYWEWLRRYFTSRKYFVEEELQIRSQIDNFQMELQALAEEIPTLSNPGKKSPLFVQSNPAIILSSPGIDVQTDHFNRRKQLEQQNRILFQKQEEFNARFSAFSREVGEFPLIPYESLAEQYGKEIAQCWSDFPIADPYGMCMAFLALVDEGSDLPWCYFPGISLQSSYVCMLPWTRTKYTESCDGVWEHYDAETGTIVPGPSPDPLPKKIRMPDVDDWYQLKYHSAGKQDSSDTTLYNLSHILYETTGCIMPRNPERYQSALDTWSRYGINSKKANLNMLYCMSLLGEAKHCSEHTAFHSNYCDGDDSDMPNTLEELQQQVRQLRAELHNCTQTLQHATDRIEAEKKLQTDLTDKLSRRDREIRDLGNLYFRVTDNGPELGVKFPYRTASHIVIFGAETAWLQKMQSMIPDAVFLQRCAKGSADLIRKADAVWIQPEHMSHDDYQRIMAEIRKFDANLRLFPNSDISECAAMLAKADIATC